MTEHTSSDTQSSVPPSGPEPQATSPRDDGPFDRLRRVDLRRSPDGWLGGVCSGLAHRVGLDPLVVRAGTVLLVIFFGLGLLLYLLAWVLLPDSRERTHVEEGLRHGAGSSIFLLVITSLVLLGSLPWWAGSAFGLDGGFGLVGLIVTALLAWGVWTVWKRRGAPGSVTAGVHSSAMGAPASSSNVGSTSSFGPPPPPPPGAYAAASGPGPDFTATTGSGSGPGVPPPPPGSGAGSMPTPPPASPRRQRRRSGGLAATAVALGLLMVILAGALWVTQGPGLPGNDLSVGLAICAAVLGVVVLTLGFAGRRAGFVGFLTGTSVLAALLAAPLPANLQWEGRSGQATWAPRSVADLREYRLAAGEAELDLTRLEADDVSGLDVDVSVGAGSMTILVPRDLPVQVDSQIGAGELRLSDDLGASGSDAPRFSDGRTNDTTSGLGVQERVNLGEDSSPPLLVDVNVGVGEIVIEQE